MPVSSLSYSALSKHPIFSQFRPLIYFVLPLGKSADECTSMKLNIAEMFAAAQAHSLNVMWVADEDCETLELKEDGNVFVFDPFGSPGFHYLVPKLSGTLRIEILSPTVLRQVLIDPQQNPFESMNSPIYTLAMRGNVICLSGFKDKSRKDQLEQLVKWMNGSLSPSLIRNVVTHVVTATACTPKCIAANEEGIPVMTEDWVRQVFKDNRELPVSANDPRYLKFRCPTFYKVNICMSQITKVKKNILKAGIEKNEGKVLSELDNKSTDILVVQKATGEKYKFAQKWKVKCVTTQWIENSIEIGYLLPTEDYPPVDSNRSELPVLLKFCQETFNAPTNHNQSSRIASRVLAQVVDGNPGEVSRKEGNLVEDNNPPTTSKKPTRMQILTNLIAECLENPNCNATGGSPIKRRPANCLLVQPDKSQEIERPHIGWGI